MCKRLYIKILQITFGIKLNDVHSSAKKWQLQKTCVSFGEECNGKYDICKSKFLSVNTSHTILKKKTFTAPDENNDLSTLLPRKLLDESENAF